MTNAAVDGIEASPKVKPRPAGLPTPRLGPKTWAGVLQRVGALPGPPPG